MKRTSVDSENPSLRVRRQIYDLTPLDLETFPVWEFNLDRTSGNGQDELTIRPCVAAVPLNPADCMFVVRAVFTLADGSSMQGYFTPAGREDTGIGTLQPIIVTNLGQVRFCWS